MREKLEEPYNKVPTVSAELKTARQIEGCTMTTIREPPLSYYNALHRNHYGGTQRDTHLSNADKSANKTRKRFIMPKSSSIVCSKVVDDAARCPRPCPARNQLVTVMRSVTLAFVEIIRKRTIFWARIKRAHACHNL